MKDNRDFHLDEGRIIVSLIDENDLSASEREHLKDCPVCTASRNGIMQQLDRLSCEAARMTPASGKAVELPARGLQPGLGWKGRWYAGLATAAAACLALIVTLSWPHISPAPVNPYGKLDLAAETTADERFLAAVKAAEENCLPVSLQEIVPETDPLEENNDDYLDFFAPLDA